MQPVRMEHEKQQCVRMAKLNSSGERDLLIMHFIHISIPCNSNILSTYTEYLVYTTSNCRVIDEP
jgi:hypothetical protein